MVAQFDPVIFSLGPLSIRWYGLMYLIGFVIAGILLRYFSRKKLILLREDLVDTFITYMILGMIIGARSLYVLVYDFSHQMSDPISVFKVWEGGLSFHGAIIGFAIAGALFAKKYNMPVLHVFDMAVTAGAQGVFFGRIGNFINGELYGRPTDVPWGIIFPNGGPYPRHPSQLYESFFEGMVLFIILFLLRKNFKRPGVLCSIFLSGYGVMRFGIEFFREADYQMGYYLGNIFTMGQILCFIMILCGVGFYLYSKKYSKEITVV